MKQEQRQVSTKRVPILWLAIAAVQLQGVCPKAVVSRGHDLGRDITSRSPRITNTSGKQRSARNLSATVSKSPRSGAANSTKLRSSGSVVANIARHVPRSGAANSTKLRSSGSVVANIARHVPRPAQNGQASGQHESVFQIHLGRARINSTKHLRRQDTSGKHEAIFQIGHTIAKTNSSKLRLANTSLTGHHRVAVKQAFAKLASEVHSVHTKNGVHSQVLIQRGTTHLRRHEPRNVEEVPLIWGVPKMVWVILADVLAMGIFLGCTVLAAWADRAVQEKGWQNGSSTPYPPDPMLLPQGRSPTLTPQITTPPPPASASLTPSFTYLKNGRPASPQFV